MEVLYLYISLVTIVFVDSRYLLVQVENQPILNIDKGDEKPRLLSRGYRSLLTSTKKQVLARQTIRDNGYPNCGEGWFDVQNQGVCNDYCRWVGNCGCRGKCSWWSCALAGSKKAYTDKGDYQEPEPGTKKCQKIEPSTPDYVDYNSDSNWTPWNPFDQDHSGIDRGRNQWRESMEEDHPDYKWL